MRRVVSARPERTACPTEISPEEISAERARLPDIVAHNHPR
jgi:hypothetical protein